MHFSGCKPEISTTPSSGVITPNKTSTSVVLPAPEGPTIAIDFPDAEQYYNPRAKRWFLQSQISNYWQSFEKDLRHEISQHYILYCFTKNDQYFDYFTKESF
jgi:hypothetical protein